MKLHINYFGPIKKGEINTKKVTVLIGNQGSGKSTVVKLLSTCCWIEKYIFRRGYSQTIAEEIKKTLDDFWEYHRIGNYLTNASYLSYTGPVSKIVLKNWADTSITERKGIYSLPKITYFPAERNFVSSIKNTKDGQSVNLWSRSLQEFKEIFQEAKESLKSSLKLPINNSEIDYNRLNDTLYVSGKGFRIPLSESASGFQSFVPMFLVSDYLSKMIQSEYEMNSTEREMFKKESAVIFNNPEFTDEQKRILLSNLASKINVKRTINIIEEPEQNLYPSSQRYMLNSLLGYNNAVSGNRLILTTHSPYILSYLMLAIQAAEIKEKAKGNAEILSKLYEIVPEKAITPMKDVVVYELNDDGTISELPQSYGLPSNDNFLNNELGKANSLFSELMEIENLCQE